MDTTTLATAGLTITEGMTTPSKAGKAPQPVWEVSGITEGWEETLYALGGKRWKGKFSFWEDPTEALLNAVQNQERTSFAERMEEIKERAEARSERFAGYAENAERRSDAAFEKSRALLEPIPPGQPILVGHHSERRHRRTLERADNAMRKSVEETDKAKRWKGRAAASARAAGPRDVGFMHRRLKEAEAELRLIRRNLAADRSRWRSTPEAIQTWEARMKLREEEYVGRVAYWKEQIEASGAGEVKNGLSEADTNKKNSLKKGDYFLWERSWYQVLRINPQTVTGKSVAAYLNFYNPRIPYAEIEQIVTAEQYAAKHGSQAA